jgi:hypothetical protein
MNKYLTDKGSDLSVALIAKTGNWYLFIIQPQNRWWKKETWEILIPIWWIWWKLEIWETLEEWLIREAKEEVWIDIEILETWKNFLVIDWENITFETNNTENKTPIFI